MIIGILGEKVAGKDELAKYLQEKHGAFFDRLEKKICDFQERLLDYSNERMAATCEWKDGL